MDMNHHEFVDEPNEPNALDIVGYTSPDAPRGEVTHLTDDDVVNSLNKPFDNATHLAAPGDEAFGVLTDIQGNEHDVTKDSHIFIPSGKESKFFVGVKDKLDTPGVRIAGALIVSLATAGGLIILGKNLRSRPKSE